MLTLFLVLDIFIFLLGLIIGSFLNCVIYRLEKEKTLGGRSFCPHCKHTLRWLDLIPVVSFMYLGAKCRYCCKKISWQYPLVEVATGLFFLLIFNVQFLPFSQFEIPSFINLIFLWYAVSVFMVIFVYDLRHYIIPDKVLLPAIVITFLYQAVFAPSFLFFNSLWAGLGASAFFLFIYLISRGNWMGFGDVKIAILLGLLLGFPNILLGMFLAFLFGAIIGVGLAVKSKKGLKSQLPFAPFLLSGTLVAMLWGSQIINWYINFIVL